MCTNSLLNEELIILDFEAEDKKDLLKKLSSILIEKGYVKDSFKEAILKREEVFPTGLMTESTNIAIPHTDAIHVIKPTILFAKLKNPVTFKEMGMGKNDVNAELIFMLAINNPTSQVTTLSKLMSILSNKPVLESLKSKNSTCEIMDILSKQLS
ncbi:PTS sugar transporter subunit IIA [Haloimpatiens sp. FM7315]|uniref:PTS sugar transporter subunit IIA n=1 Tax=Haloimpatiens sp. FM7315 TaxID=3298609 RepID=UPI0035A31982